jgi:hypothetical protein
LSAETWHSTVDDAPEAAFEKLAFMMISGEPSVEWFFKSDAQQPVAADGTTRRRITGALENPPMFSGFPK